MGELKIALIQERKKPEDRRVALTPNQIVELQQKFPNLSIVVESSPHRIISDDSYASLGISVVNDVSDCDILLGIKEVPVDALIPHKTYFFFSHTIKAQPYNRSLLQEILQKKIQLIDYETLTYSDKRRVLGFGRWAGIVGTYNALRTWGKKYALYDLPPAFELSDYESLKSELSKISLPPIKIITTGSGRVAQGIFEIMDFLKVPKMSSSQMKIEYDHMVYFPLDYIDFYHRRDGLSFKNAHFYKKPQLYKSIFSNFTPYADLLINGMYWDSQMPALFHKVETINPKFRISVIADITCDVEGSVPITTKATYPEDPVIGWNPRNLKSCEPFTKGSIDIMAVTNLPTELPLNASEDFGESMKNEIIPLLLEQPVHPILRGATITNAEGQLTKKYQYLQSFVDGI